MRHILIVDDDIHINHMLEEVLVKEGYRVSHAYSGTEALLVLSSGKPDLVLLDLMLPGLNGEEVLPKINGIPVIVISARTDIKDKVSLLLHGAVDYMTKPFDIDELLARITVQLRKIYSAAVNGILEYEDIIVHTDTHAVRIGEADVKLTKTEFAILKLLMENSPQVITKTVLLDRISQDTPDCMESSLKVHISNLRRKLRRVSGRNYIEAVWGIGFKMAEQ